MLTKQPIDISFASGLDTKTDKKRVQVGKFLQLENTVFQKGGLLQKRNGYGFLPSLPDASYSYLTTFNENLTAIGSKVAAYSAGAQKWVARGAIQPLAVETLPLIRNNLNQTSCDSVIADNGLVCTVYLESDGTTTTAKYAVADSVTGQNIVAPAAIPVASGVVTGGVRVFYLGSNFILVFTNVIAAVSHLQYVTVNSVTPTLVGTNAEIAASYIPATHLSWDGYVVGTHLYLAYNTTSGGQAIKVTYLTSGLVLATPASFAGRIATNISVTADVTNPASPVVYVTLYDLPTTDGYLLAVNTNLNTLLAPQLLITGVTMRQITTAAQNGAVQIFYDYVNAYSFDGSIASNYIVTQTVNVAGVVTQTRYEVIRSVSLASKAFIVDGVVGFLAAYQSAYQPSYFLVNATTSTSLSPVIAAKIAYQNGGGYLTLGLPGVTVTGTTARVPYLFKDLIQAVNKNTNVPTGSQTAGIYSQTGINLGSFTVGTAALDTAEIGQDLHIGGGFLWMYDGYLPVEHNFLLWPDMDITTPTDAAAWVATGGAMAAKPDGSTNTNAYYYQVTYEWTDNQGNAFRSAPSIPIAVTTTGAGVIGSVVLHIPTLRLTMKTANPVKIVIYRWSAGQQSYYQVTSITAPLLNDTTNDQVTFTDTLADASILGNNLIYTTGGVVEDVGAPATNIMTLFDTRLWMVDAEDPNVLWFSKQVIEATPVEMSDLFTLYVPPTTSTQGSTGPMRSLSVMDDKLILGKKNALLYVNGTGPDNTGAGNQYSPATLITSTVGCTNQKSFVLTPEGLMFESDKGIWMLDRNLGTNYIGAPVEDFTSGATVLSAVNVPETNQVRFTLDSGVTLMYDYFYGQWGTFTGISPVSSCIYESMHTLINAEGEAFQETPGTYLDGGNPVLMMFQTGPLRLADLQSYQRAYFFYILGEYLSPHKLLVSLSYDYRKAAEHSILIAPTNYSPPFGSGDSQSPFGQGTPFGGPDSSEDWRIFLKQQRCMAFGITVQEVFDASFGVPAGAGLTISGLQVVCAFKKGYRPQASAISAG